MMSVVYFFAGVAAAVFVMLLVVVIYQALAPMSRIAKCPVVLDPEEDNRTPETGTPQMPTPDVSVLGAREAPTSTFVEIPLSRTGEYSSPVTFKQLGYIIIAESGQLLPLYGRESQTRRYRWNYYTLVDGIKVAVTNGLRDCMEELGCEELFDGDAVQVDGRMPGQAKIYRNWSNMYSP